MTCAKIVNEARGVGFGARGKKKKELVSVKEREAHERHCGRRTDEEILAAPETTESGVREQENQYRGKKRVALFFYSGISTVSHPTTD